MVKRTDSFRIRQPRGWAQSVKSAMLRVSSSAKFRVDSSFRFLLGTTGFRAVGDDFEQVAGGDVQGAAELQGGVMRRHV